MTINSGKISVLLGMLLTTVLAHSQTYNWAYKAGGTGWDQLKATHLSSDNHIFIGGMFTQTATFGNTSLTSWGFQDGFVAKYNTTGSAVWANQINGANEQVWVNDVATDANQNVYATGYFMSNAVYFTANDSLTKPSSNSRSVFLVKYDENGVYQWAVSGEMSYGSSRGVTCDAQNNVIITGDFLGPLTFGNISIPSVASNSPFIAKFDTNGNPTWVKHGDATSLSFLEDISTDANNNVYVTGKISNPVTWGTTNVPCGEGDEMVVGKFNSSGDLVWMEALGNDVLASTTDTYFDTGNSLAVDDNGNVFVGGGFLDTSYYDTNIGALITKQYAAVLKFDNNGNQLWQQKFGHHKENIVNGITLDSYGDPYVIGSYNGEYIMETVTLPTQTEKRCFYAKLDKTSGSVEWAYENGTANAGKNTGIGIEINQQTNEIYTAGNFNSIFDFGSNSLVAQGNGDIYITLNANTASLNEFDLEVFNLYPNPANESFQIHAPSLDANKTELSIYTMTGQLVHQELMNGTNTVAVQHLPQGSYLVVVSNEQEEYRKVLVKK